jgi:hypothetical protein
MYYRFENDKIPTEDANSLFVWFGVAGFRRPVQTHQARRIRSNSPTSLVKGNRGRPVYARVRCDPATTSDCCARQLPIAHLPFVNQRTGSDSFRQRVCALQSFGPYDNFSYKQNYDGSMTWAPQPHYEIRWHLSRYRKNENALAGAMKVHTVDS